MKNRFFKIVPETFLGHLGGVGWSPACEKHVFPARYSAYSVRGSVGDFPFDSFRSRVRGGEIIGDWQFSPCAVVLNGFALTLVLAFQNAVTVLIFMRLPELCT